MRGRRRAHARCAAAVEARVRHVRAAHAALVEHGTAEELPVAVDARVVPLAHAAPVHHGARVLDAVAPAGAAAHAVRVGDVAGEKYAIAAAA